MQEIKLLVPSPRGTYKMPCQMEVRKGRIEITNLPFALKDEIKACMRGTKWLGLDGGPKVWAFEDCQRNKFQLAALQGLNPFANWEKPVVPQDYVRPLMAHQRVMADLALTRHYMILAAEMGTGKSLVYIETMERSGFDDWWFISAKSGLKAIEREFKLWESRATPVLMTYDELKSRMKNWENGKQAPQGVIFDEFSRCKNPTAFRSIAAQMLADNIREQHGWEGFVIGGSGSCAPKAPTDWWSLAEIVAPGFLRERDIKAFEWRLGFFEKRELPQGIVHQRSAWKDDENRCKHCGRFEYETDSDGNKIPTHVDDLGMPLQGHTFEKSINEVALLGRRLDGLRHVVFKRDCLDLPPVTERQIILEPTAAIKRAARALAGSATTTIQALTWLRSLSDGFQYKITESDEQIECKVCKGSGEYKTFVRDADQWTPRLGTTCERCGGTGTVPKTIRESKYFKGPKEDALEELLDECEECGRIVVYAGFTASIDLCVKVAQRKGWDVIQVDGRGWRVYKDGSVVVSKVDPLDYWEKHDGKVAFIAHPESGGMGLNLTEAFMIVFYSNDFKPENRIQAKNRIDRPGQTRGTQIVDLIHLGTDRKVMNVLNDNHRLEKLSLVDVTGAIE